MKILLINYHYFIHGGPDRYFFNVKKSLEDLGHEVVTFSFSYEETLPTVYEKYFPRPITGSGSYLLSNVRLGILQKIATIIKLFYNRDVDSKFRQILVETEPDIIYSIYLSSSFLPKIFKIAKTEFKIPVLYRLSDYHMFCPSYLFFREGRVCTDCLSSLSESIRHRCVHNSMAKSLFRSLQIFHNRARHWYNFVDTFICPSTLMKDYLVNDAYLAEGKVTVLPSFARDHPLTQETASCKATKSYGLFFGKLTNEKGIEELLHAYNLLQFPTFDLHIVGYCETFYLKKLKQLVSTTARNNVSFCGPKEGNELARELVGSLFCVLPSKWLENMPNTITESMAAGKAILSSDIGSIPEVVIHGKNGYLAQVGNIQELAEYLQLISQPEKAKVFGNYSRKLFEEKYTERIHMNVLLGLMDDLIF